MEAKKKAKPTRHLKYDKVLNEGGKLFYMKRCLHCQQQYKSKKQDAAFCQERCRKANRLGKKLRTKERPS